VTVTFISGNSTVIPAPKPVVIPAGTTVKTFSLGTNGVLVKTAVSVTAKAGDGSRSYTLTVYPAALAPFKPPTATIAGGLTTIEAIELNGGAPPAGAKVALSSDNAAATMSATATIAYDLHSGNFAVATKGVSASTVVHITGSYLGASEVATLTLTPATLSKISAPVSVKGGNSVTATVSLSGNAPPAGATVTLASDNPDVVVPASAHIAANGSSIAFVVKSKAVTASVIAHLSATYAGKTVKCNLTVTP
jgi:hypothetical protein